MIESQLHSIILDNCDKIVYQKKKKRDKMYMIVVCSYSVYIHR